MEKPPTKRSKLSTTMVKLLLSTCPHFCILCTETWTLTESLSKRLEAFDVWLYRRMPRVPWKNAEILRGERGQGSIDYRKNKNTAVFWSDYERRKQMSLTVLRSKRKIPWNRRVGKARISWLNNVRSWASKFTTELFSTEKVCKMVANIQNG